MASCDSGQGGELWSGQAARQRLRPGRSTLVAIAALCCGVTALAGVAVLVGSYGSSADTALPMFFGGGILAVVLGVIALPLVKARGSAGSA